MSTYKPPFLWTAPLRKVAMFDRIMKMYHRQGRPQDHIDRLTRLFEPVEFACAKVMGKAIGTLPIKIYSKDSEHLVDNIDRAGRIAKNRAL